MLEQNQNPSEPFGFASLDIPTGAPISVSAPRASAVSPHAPTRLAELVFRADTVLAQLQARMHEEREVGEQAARTATELDERLRLGVRMLQAFDVQVARGDEAANRAKDAVARAEEAIRSGSTNLESTLHSLVERLAREKFEWIERELSWRFDRVKEVEQRIEECVNGKLTWLDGQLAERLARFESTAAGASAIVERAEGALQGLASAGDVVERAERATAALAGLCSESERQIASIATGTSDAAALRTALGELLHEVAAAREVVEGEMRRMRDDLGWLVEKGERLTGELVEQADRAVRAGTELRAAAGATAPALEELATWTPLLAGTDRERLRPLTEAIAAGVRDQLSSDMRSFTGAIRQFATRAESTFQNVRVETLPLPADPREFARELARIVPVSGTASGMVVNAPLELSATDSLTPQVS